MTNKIEELKKIVENNLQNLPKDLDSIIWSRICIGIVTCDKHRSRFNNFMRIYQEYFDKLGIMYYIIKSNPTRDYEGSDYIVDGHNFWINAEEVYEKLLHKIIVFYSYIEKETEYSHIVKVDDGCLFDISAIIKDLNLDYIGSPHRIIDGRYHQRKCTNPELKKQVLDFKHRLDEKIDSEEFQKLDLTKVQYAMGGHAYRLSRRALTGISDYLEHAKSLELSYEDLYIGQILKTKGVTITRRIIGRYHRIPS